jgi:hypothetical protein
VCATAAVFIVRGTSPENVIFVCLGIFAAALVGLAALSTLRPLVTGETRQPEMVGNRTRAALEREKNLLLRSIKELEFDHAMGKVATGDYEEMSGRLRARAVRLLQQLDTTSTGYRELIERELASRLGKLGAARLAGESDSGQTADRKAPEPGACTSCGTVNDEDARFCKSCGTKLLALLLAFFIPFAFFLFPFASPAFAQFQMPDPKEMSGIPRPVTDLPARHVSVRLIRGQLSNNIQGHPVEMHAGGKTLTVKTDENGRAEFSGVAPGTTVKAAATVDGERLESQEFPWPSEGGIRVMLVATPKEAGAPAPQPQVGNIVLGEENRIIIDHTDDALQVYYVLDVRNSARTPVNLPSALILDVPTGATSTTVLEGGPQAVARGDRVTLSGPFSPGQTQLQVAYRLPFFGGDVTFQQRLPLPVPSLAVLMKKVGDMTLASPQLPNVQEREFEGERYLLAQGSALPAGSTLTLSVTGLPHHSLVPRRIALSLVILILAAGFLTAARRPTQGGNAARAKQLTAKREKLFNDLVRLEQQRRTGGIDASRHAERRPALIAQLERVYRDLDAESGQGGLPAASVASGNPGAAR